MFFVLILGVYSSLAQIMYNMDKGVETVWAALLQFHVTLIAQAGAWLILCKFISSFSLLCFVIIFVFFFLLSVSYCIVLYCIGLSCHSLVVYLHSLRLVCWLFVHFRKCISSFDCVFRLFLSSVKASPVGMGVSPSPSWSLGRRAGPPHWGGGDRWGWGH